MAQYMRTNAKLAKSEKSLKQQIQAKMSVEEKKKLLEDELNSKISNYESRLEDYELKETLCESKVCDLICDENGIVLI